MIINQIVGGGGEGGGIIIDPVHPDLYIPINIEYTGAVQSLITQITGTYLLEVWGAQGGSYSSGAGGKGGYSIGKVKLFKDDRLHVYVGGQGGADNSAGGFNGGGRSRSYGGSGGGGSDIRLNANSLYSRIIVAGGGGGNGYSSASPGGFGGGLIGGSGTSGSYAGGQGGTQTTGGVGTGGNGIFGSAVYSSESGGAGGGGWFGGGAGRGGSIDAAAGGGSGYILNIDSFKPEGYLVSEEYYLTQAYTKAGNETFLSPSGEEEIGHLGNGYARVTLLHI